MAGQPKVLRVAILQGKKLVQERLIKAGQPVTVGESAKNTFVFPKTHLKQSQFTLFQPSRGRHYTLRFTDGMASSQSKLKASGVPLSLEKVRTDPSVKQKGGVYELELSEDDKGKIVIEKGALAVLFQFVPEPPQQAVKPLQAMDFRPQLMDDDDPVFLGFLAIWSALAVVFMIWVSNTEPREFELEELPDRFTKMVIKKKEEPKKSKSKIDKTKSKEGKGAKREDTEEPAKAKKRGKHKSTVDEAKRKAGLKKDVLKKSKLLLKIIGTRGRSSGGVVQNVWSDQDGGLANMDAALAEAGGGVTTDSSEAIRSGSGGRGEAADIGDLGAIGGGGGGGDIGGSVQVKVEASVSVGQGDMSEFEGDQNKVKGTVKRYSGQLKYCYETRLKAVPNLEGRVEIGWTVTGGRVSGVYIVNNSTGDAALAGCMVGKIKKWRFPGDVEGDISWPFVFRAKK